MYRPRRIHSTLDVPGDAGMVRVATVYDDAKQVLTPQELEYINLCTVCTPGVVYVNVPAARKAGVLDGILRTLGYTKAEVAGVDNLLSVVHDDGCRNIAMPMIAGNARLLINDRSGPVTA